MNKLKLLFLVMILSLPAYSQSLHSISIDGTNDFNTSAERFSTTSGTALYSYLTWDNNYIYLGFSGNTPAGSVTDDARVYHIYIDTDPAASPSSGTGTTSGVAWRWQPALPFSANYHYAFKTVDNSEYKDAYTSGSWQSASFSTTNWKSSGYWEIRISRTGIGNPSQINIAAYVEEDWTGGFICGGVPSNLFTNTAAVSGSNPITFNNHYLNFYLIDQITPNAAFHADNYQWLIRLKAASSSLSDTTSWAGMASNATNGFDSGIDLPKPPAPPSNYIQVYFPHASWTSALGPNYTRDIKDLVSLDSTTSSWAFAVSTDQLNTNLTLSIDNFGYVPSNYNIRLYDITADSTHDLKLSSYTYNTGSTEAVKNFNLIVGVSLAAQEINVTPASLNFGSIKINRDTTLSLTIENLGDSTLVISNITSSSSVFTFTGGTTYNIAANSSVVVPVKFRPVSVQTYNGSLTITSNDGDEGSKVVPLTGIGLNLFPNIAASVSSLNFGAVKVGYDTTLSFKLYNNGDTTLSVTNWLSTVSTFIPQGASSFSVAKDDSLLLSVKFSPAAVTSYSGALRILSNDPDTDTLSITLSGSGNTAVLNKSISAGWNLISIPVMPQNTSAAAVIGDDIASYFLYSFSNTGGYQTAANLYPGNGYWLGVESSFTLDVTGTPVVLNDSVSLAKGWNIVSTPFVRSYLSGKVYFKRGSVTVNGPGAVTRGWIQNNYYGYNRTSGSYYSEDTLKQWSGYWFAALTDSVNMIFFKDSTSGSPLERKDVDPEIEVSPEQWYASVKAEINGISDPLLIFGADVNATDGFDPEYDLAKPPLSPSASAIQTYFEEAGWASGLTRYMSNIKQSYSLPAPGKSWTFKFISKTAGSLSLSWEEITQQIPEEIRNTYSFKLSGTGINGEINMLQQFNVTLEVLANNYYSFSINSVVTGVDDDKNKVYSFNLEQNYPNPFNPATTINYQVDKPGLVKLVVFNALGEEAAVLLNEYKDAGSYSVNFNAAALTSGVYIYKLIASENVSVKKMILLK